MIKRLFFSLVALFVATGMLAAVTVTENPAGSKNVTIAVTGEGGQIGVDTLLWGNHMYEYSSAISSDAQTLIKNATSLTITGNITAADIKTLVSKNQSNNTWTINTLNMGGATMPSISVNASGQWSVTSHDFMPNSYTKIACTNFTLPVASDGILPDYFGACLNSGLTTLTIPEGYTSLGNYAFAQTSGQSKLTEVTLPSGLKSIGTNAFEYSLISNITLPNSLESVGNQAFKQCQNLKTIIFPAGFKTLGDQVFYNTKLLDVYFLGTEAPTVGKEAFDAGTYYGNSGFQETSTDFPYGNTGAGLAERRNFINGANSFGVLHLRTDLTNEQRAKYTDITREYIVEKDNSTKYKAFYDMYYGTYMVWPGQASYVKAFDTSAAGKLWDNTTTYDSDKYMGLHKFTIAISNVYFTDTENWTFGDKGQQWWTLCVPFNMTKAQVRTVFGENTEICRLDAVTRNKEQHHITLKFQNDLYAAATSDNDIVITAHESYMIFPTVAPGTNIVFNRYQIEEGSPIPTIVTATNEGAVTETDTYTYRFMGTYLAAVDPQVNNGVGQPITMPKYSYFLGAQGSKHVFFYQVGDNGQWNHNTSTVEVFKGNTQPQSYAGEDDTFIFSSGAKVSSFFGKDTEGFTTSVELPATSPGVKSAEEKVFNLNGQLVRQGQDSLQDLPAGIYIINGKKYIKK